MSTRTQQDAQDVFDRLHADGDLSAAAHQALTINVGRAGRARARMGVRPDDVPTAATRMMVMILDDTLSIRSARDRRSGNRVNHEQALIEGHNEVIRALRGSAIANEVIVRTVLISGREVYPFVRLQDAPQLDAASYQATFSHTPLYQTTIDVLLEMLLTVDEYESAGSTVDTRVLIVTDGADNSGGDPAQVRALVDSLLRQEKHLLLGMGIDDGATDFVAVFRSMGIEEILPTSGSAAEIRQKFNTFSRTAHAASKDARASLSAGGFLA